MTGTDTGVGKTVVTGLLLRHIRGVGVNALAMKPFATGDLADAEWLNRIQGGLLPLARLTPFFFRRPLAPWVAARLEGRRVSVAEASDAIESVRSQCEVLLVEGCGGLLAPLGERFTFLDLMPKQGARVIVAAANRLGVINHVRLTIERIARRASNRLRVALVDTQPARPGDPSRASNWEVLSELVAPVPVCRIPFLGPRPSPKDLRACKTNGLPQALAALAEVLH